MPVTSRVRGPGADADISNQENSNAMMPTSLTSRIDRLPLAVLAPPITARGDIALAIRNATRKQRQADNSVIAQKQRRALILREPLWLAI